MRRSGRLVATSSDHPASSVERLIQRGCFEDALREVDLLLAAEPRSTKLLRVKHQALMGLRRFDDAIEVIARARDLRPDNKLYRKLHAIALKDSGDDAGALPLLMAVHREHADDVDILSALCVANHRLGKERAASQFGQRKLDLLVAAAPEAPSKESRQRGVGASVVSFSLWGGAAQYTKGALLNARQLPQVLPGWIARFYVDSTVPTGVMDQLRGLGAEVIDATSDPVPRLMRRFLVHDDPGVDRYIVRDTDSRIGSREMLAITDWLQRGSGFHAIRDHPFHTELIMGGLFGGTAGRNVSMRGLLDKLPFDHRYGADQYFLGQFVWPRIRDDLLTHDSHYSTPGSRPFPDGSRGTDHDHVGMGIVLRDAG
jgi:hypothetical protein